jgi:hypothetical protein
MRLAAPMNATTVVTRMPMSAAWRIQVASVMKNGGHGLLPDLAIALAGSTNPG